MKGLDLVNELEAQRVHFQSITDGVDTKTPTGRFFFHLIDKGFIEIHHLMPISELQGLRIAA